MTSAAGLFSEESAAPMQQQRPDAAAGPAKPIALALQGGGAHGAFTWGVLDRLLQEPKIAIEAISATSAGAMNATVLAYGVSLGGPEEARAKLTEFWSAVSEAGRPYAPMRGFPWDVWLQSAGMHGDLSPGYMTFQAVTHLLSPYQLNPLNLNPLRNVLEKTVDFARLQTCPVATRLYLSATNVRSGKVRIFENKELSADAVLASACLPYLFHAVEIGGEHFWDGGFMGNPAIFPLIYRAGTRDVVIVHINPLHREKLPTSAPEIYDRMNEISFNSSLMREMRAIAFVTRLLDEGSLDNKRYSRIHVHSIRDDERMAALGVATKLQTDWSFLTGLRDQGRARASAWIDDVFASLGTASSINVSDVFL